MSRAEPVPPPARGAGQDFYTPLEVAERCGLSRRRVYDWLTWGWLRGLRHGGRWVVAASDWEYFQSASRGARGRLMPSLHDWELLWRKCPPPGGDAEFPR